MRIYLYNKLRASAAVRCRVLESVALVVVSSREHVLNLAAVRYNDAEANAQSPNADAALRVHLILSSRWTS